MSQTCDFKPNFFATNFASLISLELYVSFSGSMSPVTLSPPIERLEIAAVVLLSIPPDKPRTMPSAPAFSTYSLMKRLILFSTSVKFNSNAEEVNFNLCTLLFYGRRQVFKGKHRILEIICNGDRMFNGAKKEESSSYP